MNDDLLIEVGTEDLPPSYLISAVEQFKGNFLQELENAYIGYGEVKSFATHRRIALHCTNVSKSQKTRQKEIKGPPKSIGIDENGEFTIAAKGFARQFNIDVNKLTIKNTERGEYIFAVVEEKSIETAKLLPEIIRNSISKISFQKTMRWGDSNIKFARPIRWLIVLLANDVIEFSFDSIKTERFSFAHRLNKEKSIILNSPDEYEKNLENKYVIPDPQKRESIILESMKKIEKSIKNAKIEIDKSLLRDTVYSVEYPKVIKCKFDKEYTKLPENLVKTIIKSAQKSFIVVSEKTNEILPFFVAVADYPFKSLNSIREVNEKVIRAKFKDAYFFLEEGKKIKLEERIELLDKILFQENLGTLQEKVQRLESLSSESGKMLDLNEENLSNLRRAASLCKSDLTTSIVKEYPSLQGIIGGYYSILGGENKSVSEGISEHYLPVQADDEIPSSLIGSLLSIIDKIDNIVGFFINGYTPTGSEDPFGLKRQTLAIFKICKEKCLKLDLYNLIDVGIEVYKSSKFNPDINYQNFRKNLKEFINVRTGNFLETEGIRYDVINTLLGCKNLVINNLFLTGKHIETIYNNPDFEELVIAATRVRNILLKSASEEAVDFDIHPAIFESEEEKKLFEKFSELKSSWDKILKIEDKFSNLYLLTPYITKFFDSVLVMTDDLTVRKNRVALLRAIDDLYSRIGDFSKIVK